MILFLFFFLTLFAISTIKEKIMGRNICLDNGSISLLTIKRCLIGQKKKSEGLIREDSTIFIRFHFKVQVCKHHCINMLF